MSFYNKRGAWTIHLMQITKVEERTGREACVHPIVVHLEDKAGKVRHTYGATYQGQAKRELGEPMQDAVGQYRLEAGSFTAA